MKPVLVGRLIAATGCLLSALACQTEAAPVPDITYATRDSAGTRIAENTGFPSPEDSWVVEAEPFLSIGGVSAASPAQSTVVAQAARFADGRLVILETETSELRSSTRRAGICARPGAGARDRANPSTPRPSRVCRETRCSSKR